MTIEIADELLSYSATSRELLTEIALFLFAKEKISLGKAANIVGVSKMEMQQLIGAKGIPMHYDMEMVKNDLEVIKWYSQHGRH
jgi:predicted HTH domain antitoxin